MKKGTKILGALASLLFSFMPAISFAQTSTPTGSVKITSINGGAVTGGKLEVTTGFPKFCGTSIYANTNLQVKIDSTVHSTTVKTDSSGNWCFTPVSEVSIGDHIFSVTVLSAGVSDQISFARVRTLATTGTELLIAVLIAIFAAALSVGGFFYFKKKKS